MREINIKVQDSHWHVFSLLLFANDWIMIFLRARHPLAL